MRIVGESFSCKQLPDDVGIDGFIGVHGAYAQTGQAERESQKCDEKKDERGPPQSTASRLGGSRSVRAVGMECSRTRFQEKTAGQRHFRGVASQQVNGTISSHAVIGACICSDWARHERRLLPIRQAYPTLRPRCSRSACWWCCHCCTGERSGPWRPWHR